MDQCCGIDASSLKYSLFREFCQKVQLNSIFQWELLSNGSTLSIDIVPCAREV